MILFHGTSRQHLPSIRRSGIQRTGNEVWPEEESVCALDTLEKAKEVAAYFGPDGVVVEFEARDGDLEFHPDYGEGPEFDTIHVMVDVPPSMIIGVHQAPGSGLNGRVRPADMSLRNWKGGKSERLFHRRLGEALDRQLPRE